eukprot:sb/3464465/
MKLLDEANWDLEQAVQLAFNPPINPPSPTFEPTPATPVIQRPVPTVQSELNNVRQRLVPPPPPAGPLLGEDNPNFIGPRFTPSTGPVINRNQGNGALSTILFSGIWAVYAPLRFIFKTIISVLSFAYSFFFTSGVPTQREAGREVEMYIEEFTRRYGSTHPRFYHGTLKEAMSHAQRHLRFLLVYLHSEKKETSVRFAQNVICSPLFKSVVEDNLLFWSCDTSTGEGSRVAESLTNARAPFIGLLCFKEGQMRLIYKNQGSSTVDAVISRLTTAILENEPHLQRQRNRNRVSESSTSQLLMQEQNAAFNESLLRDQEREKQRKAEEEAVRLAQEEVDRKLEEKENKLEKREELRVELRGKLEEPTKDHTISLLFRLPNGSRVARAFLPEVRIKELYEFAFTCEDAPNFFTLITNFPKRILPAYDAPDALLSCKDIGLENSTTLFLQEDDSESESSSVSEAEM